MGLWAGIAIVVVIIVGSAFIGTSSSNLLFNQKEHVTQVTNEIMVYSKKYEIFSIISVSTIVLLAATFVLTIIWIVYHKCKTANQRRQKESRNNTMTTV